MKDKILNALKGILDAVLATLVGFFPLSPFKGFIDSLEQLPFLGYLNWFIPVGLLLKIASGWLTAIGLYYLYMVVARWIKLLGN